MKVATKNTKGLSSPEKISKKEKELRDLAQKVQDILAKHNVKPFKKEIYAIR